MRDSAAHKGIAEPPPDRPPSCEDFTTIGEAAAAIVERIRRQKTQPVDPE